ncbi:hypothetical protein Taro_045882 [Colocasia esculenta]|uniref:Uncharacterized protein n=1 Tax=Colocasia esculenta TaxID=4460 RepID=A0A843X3E0_COLES|nr:hypothetical protein [Colocasia esculenta]
MAPPSPFLSLLLTTLLALAGAAASAGSGRWDVLDAATGVSAMHMQLLRDDCVVFFDRTDFGESGLPLPDGKCRDDPNERAIQHDCTAHAAVYDVAAGSVRPLMLLTDTWCSSGTVTPDGVLLQTGGFNDGERAVRTLRCCEGCDWEENATALAVRRWYATNHVLPDGGAVIVGGRRQFSYEFYPTPDTGARTFDLPFLRQTRDAVENNLYPFVHLNVDGNLFVFANNRAILLDYRRNAVVRSFPPMPGGDPRNYPSSGSSVLLPLKPSGTEAEVLVCGGAPAGSYSQAQQGKFLRTLDTCGRIRITDEKPAWEMEKMPVPRVMGDMLLLPTGDVLILNGASAGTAGWEMASDPALAPVTYRPGGDPGSRFQLQAAAATPRLYHSSAVLLRDGRVLIGGSNPHIYYNLTGVQYPTETSLEAFSPDYLSAESSSSRPAIVETTTAPPREVSHGGRLSLRFTVGALSEAGVAVTMVMPSFTTHAFAMNQRLLVLQLAGNTTAGHAPGPTPGPAGAAAPAAVYEVEAVAPRSPSLAPPGYYLVFVVNGKVPSEGVWVRLSLPRP